jgi:Uma2 family endonuclease
MDVMRTVFVGDRPPELEDLIERRRKLGQDLFDEVWEGEYHLVPGPSPAHGVVDAQLTVLLASPAWTAGLIGSSLFNLGTEDDFRVPDGGYFRSLPGEAFVPTAAIIVEVVSPYDETYAKFGFYAAHDVDEIITVEPEERRVRCWHRNESGTDYDEVEASALLDVTASQLTAGIDWP